MSLLAMTKHYAQTICLRDGAGVVDEYKAYHAEAWPEVCDALSAVGVEEMRIWLVGRRLFMAMSTSDAFDPEVDFPRHMAMSPRCVEWGARMRAFQTPVPEAKEGDWWTYMECVFDLGARDRSKPGYRNSD